MYRYGFGLDPTYILVAIGAILTMIASSHVKSTYQRFSGVLSASRMTGKEVAEAILARNGVTDVTVHHVPGSLTDHYDPKKGVVNLSDATYDRCSVAALGVAAHECGHVMQHKEGYLPLNIRTALVPFANFGSNAGVWIVLFSVMLGLSQTIAGIGVVLFSLGTLFQFVTLPVEFNASRRALAMLTDYGILQPQEEKQAGAVLKAAALTYVAAAASSVLQLLRLVMISNRGRRRE